MTLAFTPAPSKSGDKAAEFEIECGWDAFEHAREALDPGSTPFSARVASQVRDGANSEGTCAERMSNSQIK